MTLISPTPGRVVWYRPNISDAEKLGCEGSNQPLAAHVAYVHNDRLVNLMVIDPNGGVHARTSVTLIQEGDSIQPGTSYAEWMPYQVGQAKKHST